MSCDRCLKEKDIMTFKSQLEIFNWLKWMKEKIENIKIKSLLSKLEEENLTAKSLFQ